MVVQITGAWNFPTRVITGPGRIAELPEACRSYGLARPLLVTDRGLAKTDLVAGIVGRVREAGIPVSVFSDVKANPTEANLRAGVDVFRAGGHDGDAIEAQLGRIAEAQDRETVDRAQHERSAEEREDRESDTGELRPGARMRGNQRRLGTRRAHAISRGKCG